MTTAPAPSTRPAEAIASGNFTTGDPDEARVRSMGYLQCPHRMKIDQAAPFRAHVRYRRLGAVGVFDSRYATRVTIACDPFIPFFTVNLVEGGSALVARDAGDTSFVRPGCGAVIDYRRPMSISFDDHAKTRMLTLSKSRVLSFLAGLLGGPLDEPLVFASDIDVAAGGHRVAATLGSFDRIAAMHDGTSPTAAVIAEVEHAFLSALVLDHPHNYSDRLLAPSRPTSRSVVHSVVDFIDAGLEDAISIADMAEHANVSERTLFATFQRDLGVSPMSYLRTRRLERIRHLLETDAWGEGHHPRPTVSQLAYRFGFAHPGRFARAYRETYGEAPSQTIERVSGRSALGSGA